MGEDRQVGARLRAAEGAEHLALHRVDVGLVVRHTQLAEGAQPRRGGAADQELDELVLGDGVGAGRIVRAQIVGRGRHQVHVRTLRQEGQVLGVVRARNAGVRGHEHPEPGLVVGNRQLLRHPLAIGGRVGLDRRAAGTRGGGASRAYVLVHERGAADGVGIEIAANRADDAARRHLDADSGPGSLAAKRRSGEPIETSARADGHPGGPQEPQHITPFDHAPHPVHRLTHFCRQPPDGLASQFPVSPAKTLPSLSAPMPSGRVPWT